MFELYDSLKVNTNVEEVPDIKRLRGRIQELDKEGHTLVFCLVYYHNQINKLSVPEVGELVEINLKPLDALLLSILEKFSLLHCQKMNEQYERAFGRHG